MRSLKDAVTSLKDEAKSRVNSGVNSDGKVVTQGKDLANKGRRGYENSGANGKIDSAQSTISGKLDEISGSAMYQLVQERLSEQEQFNDLLATKLQEALDRISELENRLANR